MDDSLTYAHGVQAFADTSVCPPPPNIHLIDDQYLLSRGLVPTESVLRLIIICVFAGYVLKLCRPQYKH